MNFAICYCSVLDTCWVIDSREYEARNDTEHRRIAECTVDPEAEFRQ